MGVIPDTSCLLDFAKAQKEAGGKYKTRNRTNAVSSLDKYKQKVFPDTKIEGENDHSLPKFKSDKEELAEICQDDVQALLSSFEDFSTEQVVVLEQDTNLIEEFRKQQILEAFDECGDTAKQAIINATQISSSLRKQKNQKFVVDEDGDLTQEPFLPTRKPAIIDEEGDLTSAAGKTAKPKDDSGEVIYRDEDGFRITKKRWLEIQSEKKGGYRVKKSDQKQQRDYTFEPVVWGRGLVQEKEEAEKAEFEKRLVEQPFGKHVLDEQTDHELRETVRWDDPMRFMSKASKTNRTEGNRPKCPFPSPPNRFGILAGYRWDGVIRGNGYEDRLLKSVNKKRYNETNSYKWSVEDL